MTHEELLKAVKDNPTTIAVVELHKPNEQGDCYLCTTEYTVTYPCLTIKAIEKELK